MTSASSRVLLVVVAVLVGVVVGLVVGYLSYDGKMRKAISRGLGAFGATTLGIITVEAELRLF